MNKMIRTVIIVLLLTVQAAHAASPDFNPGWSDSYHIEDIKFMSAFEPLQKKIEENKDLEYELEDGSKNPILKLQHLDIAPEFWFVPLLLGRDTDCTEFCMRSDNLYMSGFSNGAGQWFRFRVPKDKNGKDKEYVIDGAIELNFGNNYPSLLKEFPEKSESAPNWKKLEGMDLSRDAVLDAIAVMNSYDPNTTPENVIKAALVTIIVVFIESQRFPHIRQLVHDAWENGDGTLDTKGAELLVNWKRTSCAIRIWDASTDKSKWDSKEVDELRKTGLGIDTPELAKAEIWPILQSEDCSK